MKNNSCPNKSTEEWKKLVEHFGEGMAMAAFHENGNVIPTIEEADKLMSNFKVQEKDEQLSRSSNKFKLSRAAAQREMLDRVRLRAGKAQQETIDKLIAMNETYQAFLKENIDKEDKGAEPEVTIAATRFLGQSEFRGDSKEYESFKLFGTFMHELLEFAQEDSIRSGKSLKELYTEAFFAKRYAEYVKKNPFDIINLTEDEMFKMGLELVEKLDYYNFTGAILLPEITVVGQSVDDKKVIGRIDMLLIDGGGNAQIIDFKTKKVEHMVKSRNDIDPDSGVASTSTVIDKAFTFSKLGSEASYSLVIRPGTNEDIAKLPRNTFDTWRVQLELYDRMLQQNGINVNKKSVFSLLYDIDKDTNEYKGQAIHIFENQDYYAQAVNLVAKRNYKQPTFWGTIDEHIKQFEEALSKAMPIPGETERQERLKRNPEEAYSFRPSQENMEKFVEDLDQVVKGQLQKINTLIRETKDERLEKIYKERKSSLNTFQNIINSIRTASHADKEAVRNAANFNTALETVEAEIKLMHDVSNESFSEFEKIMSTANKKKGVVKSLKGQTKQIFEAYQKSQTLSEITSKLEDIMREIIDDPTNTITSDNPAARKLVDIRIALSAIEANFKKAAKTVWMEVLKTPGEKVFKGVERDLKMALEPKLLKLQERLKELKEGSSESKQLLTGLRDSFYSFISKTFKSKFEESIGPEGKKRLSEIEKIESEIVRIQEILSDFDGSDRSLEKYIDGILDPRVNNYLGSQSIWNSDSLLRTWAMDSFIASVSNSDLGISAFTQMLKNQENTARRNIVNDIAMMEFDSIRQELLDKGYTLEELNDAISEWREVVYREKGATELSKRNKLFLAKPYSEEYETTYRSFDDNIRALNKEIYQLKAQYLSIFDTGSEGEVKTARDTWQAKVKERENANVEFIEWLRANANLPYVDSFYELQLGLPESIRVRLQDIYLEREILLRHVSGDEVLLNDEDWDRLIELDIEQRKLFQEAAEENEEYARRIEKFNELYEYDTNDRYFRAMDRNKKIQFADDPESYERWRKANTITRPSQEWYDDLGALYDQLFSLTSQDMILSEWYEERSKIMRPHKQGGRFTSKFLNDEEIKALDELEAKIEDRIQKMRETPSGLDKETKKQLGIISEQIRAIKTRQVNENYSQEYSSKYRILERALRDMRGANNKLILAKSSGNKEEIQKAQEELIAATVEFDQQEQKFEQWFNKNHVNKYKSIVDHGAPTKQPKSFNYENVPNPAVKDQYMETVPNPKYYKLKRLKLGNWTLDGVELKNEEIKELKKNPQEMESLKAEGRLMTKPGAYNENFIKGPDGIPLPKELMINSDNRYVITPGMSPSKNMNPKYLDIQNNSDIKRLYDALTEMFFGLQEKVEGRKTGYGVPGVSSSLVENVARNGFLAAFKKQANIFLDKHLKTTESQHDKVENVFGDLGQSLRLRFADQLSEDLQTEDVIGAVMQWTTEAHMNIAMQEVLPISESSIEFLKMQRDALATKGVQYIENEKGESVEVNMEKRKAELDEVIKLLEFESKKFLSGQTSEEKNREFQKIAGAVFGWTAFVRIGFDLANQTKNYVAGNLQAFLAAGSNENDFYSREDYLVAKKMVYGYNGFIHNYFSDWGRVHDLHDSTMLYRMYNPLQKDMIKYYEDVSGGRKRKSMERLTAPGELGFLLQDKGDTEIGVTVMYAIMNSYRFPEIASVDPTTGEKTYKRDSDGNIVYVPVHQAYAKNEQGQLVRRADVDFSEEDENRVRNTIYSEIRRAQGNYAKSDQTQKESTLLGKAMFFFRKFLVPGMLNRFGYLRPNWEGGEASLGYWRAVMQSWKLFGAKATLGEFFLGSRVMEKLGSTGIDTMVIKGEDGETTTKDIGDFYKRRVHHARRDAMAMGMLGILSFMLLSYVKRKDEDDEEIDMLTGNMIRVIWGVKMEAMSMFPVGAGSTEYVKNFTTAVPFVREANTLIRMVNHGWSLGMAMMINGGEEPDPGYDSEYYQEVWKDAFYSRKSGPYEKGDVKLVKDFADLTGIRNFRSIFHPSDRLDVLKRLQ